MIPKKTVHIEKDDINTGDIWYYAILRANIDLKNNSNNINNNNKNNNDNQVNNAENRKEIKKKFEIDLPKKLKELNLECSTEQGSLDEKDYFLNIGISRKKLEDFIKKENKTEIKLSPYQIYDWIKNSILNCKELEFLKEKQFKTKIFAKPVYKYKISNILSSLLKLHLYWEENGHPVFNEILDTAGPANALYFLFVLYYIISLFFLSLFSIPAVLSQYNIIDDSYKLLQYSFGVFIVLFSFFILKFWKRKSNLFISRNKELKRIFGTDSNGDSNDNKTDGDKNTVKYSKFLLLTTNYSHNNLSPKRQKERIYFLFINFWVTFQSLMFLSMVYIALILLKIKVIKSERWSNVISAVVIFISNQLYEMFTKFLTKKELHLNAKAFDQSIMLKLVFFEFLNFIDPIFISFFKNRFPLFGVPDLYESCDNMYAKGSTGCYGDLEDFMRTMFLTNFAMNIFVQFVWYYILQCYKKYKHGGVKKIFWETIGAEHHFYGHKFKLFSEYNYIIVQTSFLIIFGTACPLAPVICLFLYSFEFLVDTINVLCFYRLPKHTSFKELADWDGVFLFHGIMAIIIVPFLIGFSYPLVDYNHKMWVICCILFFLQAFKIFVEICINDHSPRLKEEKGIEQLGKSYIRHKLKTEEIDKESLLPYQLNIPLTRQESA